MDDETRRELMRKKLCFNCRDPWVPGHRCMGKGEIHYIEVEADSVDSEEEPEQAEEQPPRRPLMSSGAHPSVVP